MDRVVPAVMRPEAGTAGTDCPKKPEETQLFQSVRTGVAVCPRTFSDGTFAVTRIAP